MTARIRVCASELFFLLAIGGCFHVASDTADEASYEAKRRTELQALVAQPSPSTLTTAALMSYPLIDDAAQSLEFIERAETLAPERPELVWVQRSICQRSKCSAAQSIEKHLKELDPDNGFAWIPDLERAEKEASDSAITDAIRRIGATKKMTFYWNRLQVTVFDALAVAAPKDNVSTRAIEATSMLSLQIIPVFQTLTRPCRADQFGIPGRREACEAMTMRMELADSVITQSLALSMQERWWPVDSTQQDNLRMKHRQLHYEMQMSSRVRWRMNHDMSIRIEAARKSEREEDVMLAVMKSYGIPLAVPPNWRDKRQAA